MLLAWNNTATKTSMAALTEAFTSQFTLKFICSVLSMPDIPLACYACAVTCHFRHSNRFSNSFTYLLIYYFPSYILWGRRVASTCLSDRPSSRSACSTRLPTSPASSPLRPPTPTRSAVTSVSLRAREATCSARIERQSPSTQQFNAAHSLL